MNNTSHPPQCPALPPGIAVLTREQSRAEWILITHSMDRGELPELRALIASMIAAGQFQAEQLCIVEMPSGKAWALARRKAAAPIVDAAREQHKSLPRHRRPAAWA